MEIILKYDALHKDNINNILLESNIMYENNVWK